jgi:hypothetical protein
LTLFFRRKVAEKLLKRIIPLHSSDRRMTVSGAKRTGRAHRSSESSETLGAVAARAGRFVAAQDEQAIVLSQSPAIFPCEKMPDQFRYDGPDVQSVG